MLARQGRTRRPRRAAAALWALLTLTTMLMSLALALNAGWLTTAKQELGSAADAAALAGANALLDDAWLNRNPADLRAMFRAARESSGEFASRNRVLGRPLQLDTSDLNFGDVVLGRYNPEQPGTLTPADLSDPTMLTLDEVNIVAVTGVRSAERGTAVPLLLGALVLRPTVDMRVSALGYLDRDVIGFRARPGIPIPLVPIGIRSDPTAADIQSWENQIVDRNGPDEYRFNDAARIFTLREDNIPEIVLELQLGPSGDPALSNATLLTIGTGRQETQIEGGVTERDLRSRGGRLVLNDQNVLTLPGTNLVPVAGSEDLKDALTRLSRTGEKRVWPLVSDVTGGTATVNAFVAARVVRVEQRDPSEPLRIRLQPTLLAVPQAITDFSRRGTAHLLPSNYLAKPRVVR